MRRVRFVVSLAAPLFALVVLAGAERISARQQQPPPRFQSRLDVVAVDVHVVDKSGRPVADLRPDEFTVTVDGKPRSIVAADYVSYPTTNATPTPAAAPELPRPVFTTNRGPAPRPGRWILLVVDEDNIMAGYARHAATAAARFIDQLQPNDRVGLLVIPRSGTHIDPTTDRAPVKEALQHLVGHMVPVETTIDAVQHLAMSEAFAFQHDPREWVKIIDRECTKPGMRIPASVLVQGLPTADILSKYAGAGVNEERLAGDTVAAQRCKGELEHNARTTMQDARQRMFESTRALSALLEALAQVPGPKTVVLVSQELPVSRYTSERADFNAEISRLTPAAARAQTSFYVLHLDRPPFDAETRMAPSASGADSDMRAFGLETVTSVTGGKRLMVSGAVEPAMDRIALEISGYYLLGFRAEAADRDGKPHAIKVTVQRPGVELRARPMFAISDEAPKNASASGADVVNRLLRSPDMATELPVSVTTYALPDPADASQVRLLIVAEVDRLDAQEAPTTVGYVILDGNGRNAGGTVEQLVLKSSPSDPDRRLQYLAAATVPPGRYTVRLAASDLALRAGSVQHVFDARLASAGPLSIGDLVVFDRYADEAGKPRPGVSATVSRSLNCYLEGHAAGALPPNVAVRLEVADTEAGSARATGTMTVPSAAAAGRVPMNGAVPLADVPPGDYVARAIVTSGSTVLGRVTRPVHVVASATPAAAPPAPAAPAPAPSAPVPPAAAPPSPPPAAAATPASPAPTFARKTYSGRAKTVEELMERVGQYCSEYADQLSLVIGVEQYSQWMQTQDMARPVSQKLVSEFVLVRGTNDWDGFRDVYEVDGKPVADRHDRLVNLFTQSPASAVAQSKKIADESARYNMGPMQRNFNVPTIALFFVKAENQARFKFTRDADDQVNGVPVWKIRYEETRKPTIIRTSQGKDMPVHGTLWIDPEQGRVLKTHMEITSEAMLTADRGNMSNDPDFGELNKARGGQTRWGDNRRVNTSASITVTYNHDARLGMLVPAEMLETYEGAMRSRFTGNEIETKINCRATYSDFKRFETGGRVIPK